ncbi:MAG: hypothetical protein WC757_04530 [Candidatus Paceibacterota bacterium]|jgi:hypothetical protein
MLHIDFGIQPDVDNVGFPRGNVSKETAYLENRPGHCAGSFFVYENWMSFLAKVFISCKAMFGHIVPERDQNGKCTSPTSFADKGGSTETTFSKGFEGYPVGA